MQSVTFIPAAELVPSANGTIRFEGEDHGAAVSMFLVNNRPGEGPALHVHPYSELWIVRAGRALFTGGDEQFEAGPGDIAVVGPNVPHKFVNIGDGRLELTCIHASSRIIQQDLE